MDGKFSLIEREPNLSLRLIDLSELSNLIEDTLSTIIFESLELIIKVEN